MGVLTVNSNDSIQKNTVKAVKKPFRFRLPRIGWNKLRIVLALLLLVGVSSGTSAYITARLIDPQVTNSTNTTQYINVDDNNNVVGIVEKVSTSVVNISTKTVGYGWFGQKYVTQGAGTGIIITENGYILTNNHVIEGSDSITITTHDDKEYDAEIISTDSSKDLALIKVSSKSEVKLAAVVIGDSDSLKVGEEVLAIGNVMGIYPNSVTKGIVSGLGRPIVTEGSSLYGDLHELDDLIQTDTAINSGNSGGPLVNMKGEVVGINTAIDGSAQNIGFSVPINHAKELVKEIDK